MYDVRTTTYCQFVSVLTQLNSTSIYVVVSFLLSSYHSQCGIIGCDARARRSPSNRLRRCIRHHQLYLATVRSASSASRVVASLIPPRPPTSRPISRHILDAAVMLIGVGRSGRSRSVDSNALSLLHIDDAMQRGASFNVAINEVAVIEQQRVKGAVAHRATTGRSVTETRSQTEEELRKVTKMQCSNMVKHCHDWIDDWLKREEANDLRQCGTLAGVVKHVHLLRIANAESKSSSSSSSIPSPHHPPSSAHHDSVVPMDIDHSSSSSSRSLRIRHLIIVIFS